MIAEVKPVKDTIPPVIPANATPKKLKALAYDLKEYTKNLAKWGSVVEYCKRKGFEFIIITEEHLNKFSKK